LGGEGGGAARRGGEQGERGEEERAAVDHRIAILSPRRAVAGWQNSTHESAGEDWGGD
jgi:hypothetical protein